MKIISSFFVLFLALTSHAQEASEICASLPLILINTNGQDIVDEPKITANMKIIDNGPGSINCPTDLGNGYDGEIGIEIRGNISAHFPQKPYGIETRETDGSNRNVSLFGMPEENDWILLSNYNDKVFFRNIISFDLFERMGHYAPRTKLCEVVVNDEYQGVYVFTEKIKRDKNRIDIAALNEDENSGDDLTGGYIFRVDYWDSNNSWPSDYENPKYPASTVHFVYNYPDENEITEEQKTYLQSAVSAFEDALWGPSFQDPAIGYRKYIDVPSFIDYFIVSEFSRNVDGYKKSRNLYKDKDSQDPLIYAGPVWDFDFAYKDYRFTEGRNWHFNYEEASDVTPPGWYIRLMQDPQFRTELDDRYRELRSTLLDTTYLFDKIDSLAILVDGAQQRHYATWSTLGVATGTPEFGNQPETYEEEVIKFKGWIAERLAWLDENMPPEPDPLPTPLSVDVSSNSDISIYPNPAKDYLNVVLNTGSQIDHINIYHIDGSLAKSYHETAGALSLNVSGMKGVYLIVLLTKDGTVINRRLLIK